MSSLYVAGAVFTVIALLLFVLVYAINRLESRTSVLTVSLAEANQELTYLALHDSLTKLPNRILLEDRLDQAIQNVNRKNGCLVLMFMDLDGFKAVNDAYAITSAICCWSRLPGALGQPFGHKIRSPAWAGMNSCCWRT
jgi:predicted signal transduction protein with EAL and GGDEF domain